MKRILAAILMLLTLSAAPYATAATPEREFLTGYAGSLPGDKALLARTYFDNPNIRALIYDLEKGPANKARVSETLKGTGYTLDDLLRVKILRRDRDEFYIGFNYFTRADMEAIYAAADKYTPSLVAAFEARKADFKKIFRDYPAKKVPSDTLVFAFVAGYSLNWDGLKVTEQQGWRKPDLVRGESADGQSWQYSFWAAEETSGHSTHGYIWGSSTFPARQYNFVDHPLDFAFSSFGDPYSDPRMNFPDLLYLPGKAMAEPVRAIATRIGLADRSELGGAFEIQDALGLERGRSIGAILFALRAHPQTEKQLQRVVDKEDQTSLPDLLALLEETQYVEKCGRRYYLLAPVFDESDHEMFDRAMALSRSILTDWLNANYDKIRANLPDLVSLQQGVPYESLFTQIWHDLFGLTTKKLVEDGFMADPYGADRRYKGSLPTVWRTSLYDAPPG